jgi:D-alanyl-D-alanine carboxypeptidase
MKSRMNYNLNSKRRYRIKWKNIMLLLAVIALIVFGVKFLLNGEDTPVVDPEEPIVAEPDADVELIDFTGYSTESLTQFCTDQNLKCIFNYEENDIIAYDLFIKHDKKDKVKTGETITFWLSNGEGVSLTLEGYTDIDQVINPEALDALVNKNNQLPSDYEPSDLRLPDVLVTSNNRVLRDEVATKVEELFAKAKEAGYRLGVASAYRSYSTQEGIYNNYKSSNGEEKADTFSARPGHSEHQTGLALDWYSPDQSSCTFSRCLKDTEEYAWMDENMHLYGFILSYPEDNEAGYMFEPWHIRYVGIELATFIKENNLTLDAYYAEGKNLRQPLNK